MKGMSIMPSDTIRNHQTNNSTSKNAYQFSKEKRFPDPNPEYFYFLCKDVKLLFIRMIVNYLIVRLLLAMVRNQILLRI